MPLTIDSEDIRRVKETIPPHLDGVKASFDRILSWVSEAQILSQWQKDVLVEAKKVQSAKGKLKLTLQDLGKVAEDGGW